MDYTVLSAVIQAGGLIVSALITALAASLVGRKFANQQALKLLAEEKQQDIEFLLQVEKQHCELHRNESGQSNRNIIREQARSDGFVWSGKNTSGRAKNR